MRMIHGPHHSLVDVLRHRATSEPDSRAYTFLEDGEREGDRLTWGALDVRARAIGAAIAERVAPGDRVLVMFTPGLDFVPAFFGTLAAGGVAVPTYPPSGSRSDRTVARLGGMVADAGIALVVAPSALVERRPALEALVPGLRGIDWLTPEAIPDEAARAWKDPGCDEDHLALLQYTSGSTAVPRGVMVSHGNLLHNLGHGARLGAHTRESVAVSWLPVNHDMGLIDGLLQPAFSGFPAYLMAPAAFLQRPARWLQAISRFGATHSGGPNFAYDLCARRISAQDRATFDLGSWRIAYNGSEPVRYGTLETFQEAFGPCGFRFSAFRPAYGLAESTLLVTGTGDEGEPEPLHVDAATLARGTVTLSPAGATGSRTLVSSGAADGISRLLVVDPSSRLELDPGRVGEIWVAGRSVARGYWRREEETAATFGARLANGEGPYLRTGDLGFVRDGRLFVTGRIKDVLIIRGLKHHPQDLEHTAERSHPALRLGGCAAFALPGGEEVAIVAELDSGCSGGSGSPDSVTRSIVACVRRSIAEAHHIALAAVALVPPGTVPKTTSGKLQRYLCRDALVSGTLPVLEDWIADPELLRRVAS